MLVPLVMSSTITSSVDVKLSLSTETRVRVKGPSSFTLDSGSLSVNDSMVLISPSHRSNSTSRAGEGDCGGRTD